MHTKSLIYTLQLYIQTHANHCSDLVGPLHNHYATTYSLHRDSSLNTLKYFHVTEGLIPDIMHDCLEGCVQYEVKELLKYLSSNGILSVSTIQHLIQSFLYSGPDAKNQPSPITAATLASPDHCLKQTCQFTYSFVHVHVSIYICISIHKSF